MPTTYLTRPVFDFELAWSEELASSLAYDLREQRSPVGPVVFRPSQRYEASAWDFGWVIEGNEAIALLDDFESGIKGMLHGFWFPEPQECGRVADQTAYAWSSPADDNKILVEDTGLAELFAAVPQLHVQFAKSGGTPILARVTAVAAGPAGYEIATLSIARPAIDPDWMMQRLIYVQFAQDGIERQVERPALLSLSARVVELPTEYASYETGQVKVWFYRFFIGGPGTVPDLAKDWFYTGAPAAISSTYGGTITSKSHTSAPLTHGEIRFAAGTLGASCTLEAPFETGGPFERLLPVQAGEQLWLQIRWADAATPNSTTLVFTGELEDVAANGTELAVTFANGKAFQRSAPGLRFQSWCGHRFGDPDTCKASVPSTTVTVTAVSGRSVTVSGSLTTTEGFYANGWLDAGSGRAREVIAVVQSVDAGGGNVLLTLARAPRYGASTGGFLKRGCRKTEADCIAYQGDLENFGGFRHVPKTNPTVTPEERAPHPNKK